MTLTKSPAVTPLFVVTLVLGFIFVPQLASFYVELFEIYREIYPALHQVNSRIYDHFRV